MYERNVFFVNKPKLPQIKHENRKFKIEPQGILEKVFMHII